MLIEDGYAHSIKLLLEKSAAEETALAERRAHDERCEMAHPVRIIDRIIDWVARLWTRYPVPSSGGGIR
jgi:hypothetical protein